MTNKVIQIRKKTKQPQDGEPFGRTAMPDWDVQKYRCNFKTQIEDHKYF